MQARKPFLDSLANTLDLTKAGTYVGLGLAAAIVYAACVYVLGWAPINGAITVCIALALNLTVGLFLMLRSRSRQRGRHPSTSDRF